MTENSSLEAHLADHGIELPRGAGRGRRRTRTARAHDRPERRRPARRPARRAAAACRSARGRPSPTTARSTARPSPTTTPTTTPPPRASSRLACGAPVACRAGGPVVNVYGNSDAGDVSAGLHASGRRGPSEVGRARGRGHADRLAPGRRGARRAGRDSSRAGPASASAASPRRRGRSPTTRPSALSYLTGSEEGRGPLFDATGESTRAAASRARRRAGRQGRARSDDDRTLEPTAVPLTAARLGDHLIVTIPGEATSELGRRTRAAVRAAVARQRRRRVVVAGYANEYASYFTTPEEYGAPALRGRDDRVRPRQRPVPDHVAGRPRRPPGARPAGPGALPVRPDPRPAPDGAPLSVRGRTRPRARAATGDARALATPSSAGAAAPSGTDRPLDTAFVSVQRRAPAGWSTVDTDLGLRILWRVADGRSPFVGLPRFRAGERGTYRALLGAAALGADRQIPVRCQRAPLPPGTRARSGSSPRPRSTATVTRRPRAALVRLAYPAAVPERDITARPRFAATGAVTLTVAGRRATVRVRGGLARVPAGRELRVRVISARDRFGNR